MKKTNRSRTKPKYAPPLEKNSPSPGTAENAMTYGVKHPVHSEPSSVTRNQTR